LVKRILKIVAALGCVGILFLVGYTVYFFYIMGMFNKDYTVSELRESFTEKKIEIYELKRSFSEIVPNGTRISIEFDDDNTLNRLSISYFLNNKYEGWNLETNTTKMDSIIKPLGWTRQTLQNLKSKLDAANCIGISNGDPINCFQAQRYGFVFF
jgi:hypothetical protein